MNYEDMSIWLHMKVKTVSNLNKNLFPGLSSSRMASVIGEARPPPAQIPNNSLNTL